MNPPNIAEVEAGPDGVTLTLSPRMAEDLALAASLVRLSIGWGHGPGAQCGKGERIAGFYYRNAEAKAAEVYPAHCIGAARDLILELAQQVRAHLEESK